MTKQVLSIQQMLHLQKLGIEPKETLLHWAREVATEPRAANHYGKWILVKGKGRATVGLTHWEYVPAFTLQDIIDRLPQEIDLEGKNYLLAMEKDYVGYLYFAGISQAQSAIGEGKVINKDIPLIDYAYEILLWCINQGHLKVGKEERL